jgi:hypothetical protein
MVKLLRRCLREALTKTSQLVEEGVRLEREVLDAQVGSRGSG